MRNCRFLCVGNSRTYGHDPLLDDGGDVCAGGGRGHEGQEDEELHRILSFFCRPQNLGGGTAESFRERPPFYTSPPKKNNMVRLSGAQTNIEASRRTLALFGLNFCRMGYEISREKTGGLAAKEGIKSATQVDDSWHFVSRKCQGCIILSIGIGVYTA